MKWGLTLAKLGLFDVTASVAVERFKGSFPLIDVSKECAEFVDVDRALLVAIKHFYNVFNLNILRFRENKTSTNTCAGSSKCCTKIEKAYFQVGINHSIT